MASKGEKRMLKRLAAPKSRTLLRKQAVWTVKGKSGPHSKKTSVPLCVAIRDLLAYARNLKEVKVILNSRKVKVDGKVVTETSFPIGLFDLIEFADRKEKFRAVFDFKGRLKLIPANQKEKEAKICRIENKRTVGGNKIHLQLNDGKTILLDKTELKPGDSVLISLPEQKILESVALKKGALAYFIAGTHVGKRASIARVSEGTMARERLVALVEGEKKFQTTGRNVMVIGEAKPLIDLEE